MPDDQKKKKIIAFINRVFLIYDAFQSIICIVFCFVFMQNRCWALTFLIFTIYSLFQTLQHYLIYKFPTIDINKHHAAYRRIVLVICIVDIGYLVMSLSFWQKTAYHPVYCALCVQMGISAWIGVIFIFHVLFMIAWAITLMNAYITRRYYLLALGGFQVEQRLLEERARQLNAMLIVQPDINPLPLPRNNKDKYYKFEDVEGEGNADEQKYFCSICLNQKVEHDHFVDAGCGHFYHQICLIQWAQINERCPQCRVKFQQINPQSQQQQQRVAENSNNEYLPHIQQREQEEESEEYNEYYEEQPPSQNNNQIPHNNSRNREQKIQIEMVVLQPYRNKQQQGNNKETVTINN